MRKKKEQFREMVIKNKMQYIESYSPFRKSPEEFNEKVECIHCGNKFIFNEFKVIREMESGHEYIVCKHYPECDGTIIDFF
ncbi:MAG: hypothetical protein CVV21_05780 [Candidatus Goldiibacteriota bacterium HGW-Goldbacteria-1]|jgi:ssDNA-binding Zn-finger/Zn-ribbon topoisomerase 1|nr:MAG: hypothetical protein CVV21_05780 [Candidatus Goldiibacteriota bacterium HGW-Goldbacteria-1]